MAELATYESLKKYFHVSSEDRNTLSYYFQLGHSANNVELLFCKEW